MRRTSTTELIVETEEIVVLKPSRAADLSGARGWCATCAGEVELLTPEAAAVVARLTPRAIYRRVETGRLHFNETETGQLFICRNALADM